MRVSIILPSIVLLTDLEASSSSLPNVTALLGHSATHSALAMHCDMRHHFPPYKAQLFTCIHLVIHLVAEDGHPFLLQCNWRHKWHYCWVRIRCFKCRISKSTNLPCWFFKRSAMMWRRLAQIWQPLERKWMKQRLKKLIEQIEEWQ